MPVFFFGFLLLVFLIHVLQYQDQMQWKLTNVARAESVQKATTSLGSDLLAGLSIGGIRERYDKESGVIELIAEYDLPIPYPFLYKKSVHLRQRVQTRAFCGVTSREEADPDDTMVYVAEHGRVYHRNRECTYLYIKISQVLMEDVANLRNASGSKYEPCASCVGKAKPAAMSRVYVANYGECYHSRENCSRIRRTIIEMKKSEVGNRHACSKCGSGG